MSRLLSDTFDEWADEVRVPHDLADRALRGRRSRWLPLGAALLVGAMIAAVALFVAVRQQPDVRPAQGVELPVRPSPAPTDVRTDTENVPPARLITAGNLAVSAYYETTRENIEDGTQDGMVRERRTWSVYDPASGGYVRTPYAWVDVAPGLQVAAVIDGDLMGNRVGVLDLNTRSILAWYELDHDVAAVAWSPDGTKILATAYSAYPDVFEPEKGQPGRLKPQTRSPRTGYYVIDVPAGTYEYRELAPLPASGQSTITRPRTAGRTYLAPPEANARQDLYWSLDGELIWTSTISRGDRVWYTIDGREADAPEGQRYVSHSRHSALSPDGRLLLGPDGLPTKITDVETGKVAGRQRVLRLLAWADDDHVIALGCAGRCENEFDNGLVLVSVDGSEVTRLAAYTDNQQSRPWEWVLTPR